MLNQEQPAPPVPSAPTIKHVPLINEALWNDPNATLASKIEAAIDSKIENMVADLINDFNKQQKM